MSVIIEGNEGRLGGAMMVSGPPPRSSGSITTTVVFGSASVVREGSGGEGGTPGSSIVGAVEAGGAEGVGAGAWVHAEPSTAARRRSVELRITEVLGRLPGIP